MNEDGGCFLMDFVVLWLIGLSVFEVLLFLFVILLCDGLLQRGVL
jgi:hypothetical protein